MILGLCERFGCLPSQLLAEDIEMLRWVTIEGLGGSRDVDAYPALG
jgi:hypothetical protein